MAAANGLEAVTGAAVAATRAALPAAETATEQLGLELDDPDVLGFADPHAMMAEAGAGGLANAVARWRANGCKGRKPGAVGRRSAELADYLLQFGPHPAVGMMKLQGRSAALLAAELGCSSLEAAELQHKARAELLPYFEGKQPVRVQVSGQGHMTLNIVEPALVEGEVLGVEAVPIGFAEAPAEMAENRGFSAGAGESRNGAVGTEAPSV